jgi:Flp pilus assembly pilin Flp
MLQNNMSRGNPKHGVQQGQAMVEYILIVGIVALVMFVPSPLTQNMAPADLLARAVRTFFRGYSFLISVF